MAQTTFNQDVYVAGNLSAQTLTPPAGSITDASVIANAQVSALKLQRMPSGAGACVQLFAPATTVTALTQTLFMANASGTLQSFGAWVETQATGADRTVTVDLQASVGGGAYATVLSATVNVTNVTVIRTLVTGTINTAAYVAGTIFRAVVTVGGAAAAQAVGLTVRLLTAENSQ